MATINRKPRNQLTLKVNARGFDLTRCCMEDTEVGNNYTPRCDLISQLPATMQLTVILRNSAEYRLIYTLEIK